MTQIGIRQLHAAGRNFQDYRIEENFWLWLKNPIGNRLIYIFNNI